MILYNEHRIEIRNILGSLRVSMVDAMVGAMIEGPRRSDTQSHGLHRNSTNSVVN